MRAALNAVRSKCGPLVVPSSDVAMRQRSWAVDIRASPQTSEHIQGGEPCLRVWDPRRRSRPWISCLVPVCLGENTSFLLTQLGRESLAEIIGLEYRADLDLATIEALKW